MDDNNAHILRQISMAPSPIWHYKCSRGVSNETQNRSRWAGRQCEHSRRHSKYLEKAMIMQKLGGTTTDGSLP